MTLRKEPILSKKSFVFTGWTKCPQRPCRKPRDCPTKPDIGQRRAGLMRRALAGRGLVEAVTWSFISAEHAAAFDVAQGLELANPISSDLSHMRPSLLPGLMVAAQNADRGARVINLFELGNEFKAATPGAQRFAAAGLRAGLGGVKTWTAAARPVDAYAARADAEAALAACGVATDTLQVLSVDTQTGPDVTIRAFRHFGAQPTRADGGVWRIASGTVGAFRY